MNDLYFVENTLSCKKCEKFIDIIDATQEQNQAATQEQNILKVFESCIRHLIKFTRDLDTSFRVHTLNGPFSAWHGAAWRVWRPQYLQKLNGFGFLGCFDADSYGRNTHFFNVDSSDIYKIHGAELRTRHVISLEKLQNEDRNFK